MGRAERVHRAQQRERAKKLQSISKDESGRFRYEARATKPALAHELTLLLPLLRASNYAGGTMLGVEVRGKAKKVVCWTLGGGHYLDSKGRLLHTLSRYSRGSESKYIQYMDMKYLTQEHVEKVRVFRESFSS